MFFCSFCVRPAWEELRNVRRWRLSIIPACMRPHWKEFIDAFEIWDGLLVGGHWVAEMRNAVSAIAIGTDFGTTGDCGALLPSRKCSRIQALDLVLWSYRLCRGFSAGRPCRAA